LFFLPFFILKSPGPNVGPINIIPILSVFALFVNCFFLGFSREKNKRRKGSKRRPPISVI
jgi:hypothetical protein